MGRRAAPFDLEVELPATTISKMVGTSITWLGKLATRGLLPRTDGTKRYPLGATILAYCEYLRGASSEQGEGDGEAQLDPKLEDARLKFTKRQIAELELAELRGQLIRTEDIRLSVETVFGEVRSRLRTLPHRIAQKGEGLSRQELRELARAEVEKVLAGLAATRIELQEEAEAPDREDPGD